MQRYDEIPKHASFIGKIFSRAPRSAPSALWRGQAEGHRVRYICVSISQRATFSSDLQVQEVLDLYYWALT